MALTGSGGRAEGAGGSKGEEGKGSGGSVEVVREERKVSRKERKKVKILGVNNFALIVIRSCHVALRDSPFSYR